ncbi:MAG: Holliday junction branch migration protein RuvA [Gemmatimonadota bacterium]|nr:MAG: Holliday junction branch migration protein RuvA [Gemmatimonadota bacterium]
MISRLNGVLLHKDPDRVEIRTPGGTTYEVLVPTSALSTLPALGSEVELRTALVGREDGMDLYGFPSELERQLFLRLKSASGVGPRLALTLLGAMSAPQLVEAIRGRDLGRLQTVSGVGKKKAERLALELGDKLEDMVAAAVVAAPETGLLESAVGALQALGYSRAEAEAAVRSALRDRDAADRDVESLVREALAGIR